MRRKETLQAAVAPCSGPNLHNHVAPPHSGSRNVRFPIVTNDTIQVTPPQNTINQCMPSFSSSSIPLFNGSVDKLPRALETQTLVQIERKRPIYKASMKHFLVWLSLRESNNIQLHIDYIYGTLNS